MQKKMREDQKGSKECYFLIKAMQCCDDFPKGEIEKLTHPDFRITQNDGTRIGIEITEYYRGQEKVEGSDLRRDEEIRQQIADAAKRLYESKSTIPLWVTFSACNNLQMKGKRIADIADALVGVIVDNIPDVGNTNKTVYLCESENPLFQNVLSSLTITHLRGIKSSEWGFCEATFPSINPKSIQSIIKKKHDKLNVYRENCDSVWLLIVAAENKLSASVPTAATSKLAAHKFVSDFDCVLFYDEFVNAVTALPISPTAR